MWPKKLTMYLHSSKESNYDYADELGLSDEAAQDFKYALMELAVEVLVNEDGTYEIVGTYET